MAFKLQPVVSKSNTFTAAAGRTVTIEAEASQGAVVIQAISYNGVTVTTPPFQFTTVAGMKKLAVVFAASDPAALVSFYEIDAGSKRLLGVRLGVQNKAVFTIN